MPDSPDAVLVEISERVPFEPDTPSVASVRPVIEAENPVGGVSVSREMKSFACTHRRRSPSTIDDGAVNTSVVLLDVRDDSWLDLIDAVIEPAIHSESAAKR